MIVYLDIIWALNLFFDALLLYLTAVVLKYRVSLWRIFLGGLIGSSLILLAFTPMNYTGHPLTKLTFSVLMVLVVFGFKRFRFFLKCLMLFYMMTFLIGGALVGAHYFIQFDLDMSASVALANMKGFGDPISWLFVLLGFPLAWHFSKQSLAQIEMTKIQYDQTVIVNIVLDDLNLTFKGLIDSGNQLYDPISRTPVMIVSIKAVENDFPLELKEIAENPEGILTGETLVPSQYENRMKVIPFNVVGQEHQLSIAFKPDSLKIIQNEKTYHVEKGLVCFTTQQLSSENRFECIVHPKMLTGKVTKNAGEKVS
ncbi:sigma-E processing peptidase SpoIIGA [Bacillus sp. B15-48]|uniref:sigma-E processing peptidase SpoIIGA n=1 Tax=Bacillus sp. B15-48 TaxID=1548601 RepID=UPI00193F28BC|nr:sigma-E processing peptidase SpoIIGA [Bacillus sp. B15-48]